MKFIRNFQASLVFDKTRAENIRREQKINWPIESRTEPEIYEITEYRQKWNENLRGMEDYRYLKAASNCTQKEIIKTGLLGRLWKDLWKGVNAKSIELKKGKKCFGFIRSTL